MGGQHRLLLICSLMGLARSQTTTATTAGPTVTPSAGCWYEALCAYSGIPQLSIPSPQNADLDSRMAWCYNQCQNDLDCTDFTVFSTSRGHNCYLLTNCDDISTTEACLEQGSCNSGPKDCASNDNCEILQPAPADTIAWECDHDVNPYEQQASEGTECFISCNGWMDSSLNQASIVSKCLAGQWQASQVVPDYVVTSEVLALPNPLPQPDDVTQVDCGCPIVDMAWKNSGTEEMIDYDPNTLPGTDFLCTGPDYITDDGTDLKFKLQPGMTCRMFCDNYHIATMTCVNGLWTGEPELGAWCYAEPDAADDMGAGTVGPTITTTTTASPTGA